MDCARTYRWIVWALAGLVVTLVSYHGTVLSGLEKMTYDAYDGRLLIGIVDHWYRVVLGEAEWRTLPIYYPETNTLGYSDALFALGVPHAVLRLMGADRYLAAQLSSMFLTWLGFVGMYHLGFRLFRGRMVFALYAAALYCLLSPVILISLFTTHVQLLAVHIVPWILLALFELLRPEQPVRHWFCWAMLLGFLVGACLLTGFYTGWFLAFCFTLFCLLAATMWWVPAVRGQLVEQILERDALKRLCVRLGIAGGISLLCLIPFVMTYAPVAKRGYERTFEEVYHGLPVPAALVNVGETNYVWGQLVSPLVADEARKLDMIFGFPPLTLFLFVLASIWILWQLRRHSDPSLPWLGAGVAISWIWLLLTVRLGEWTLWRLVFEAFPRADLIRIPQRGNILLCIPIALCLTFAGGVLWRKAGSRWARAAIILLGIAVLVEQIPSHSAGRLSRSHELKYLASHPPAPGKGLFTIVDSGFMDGWASHAYALELAQERGMVTFDGYSGFPPAAWHWAQPGSPGHLANLLPFIDKLDLDQPVYGYSVPDRMWYPLVESDNAIRTELGTTIDFSSPASVQHLGWGFASQEDWGVWTVGEHAIVHLWPKPLSEEDLTLRLRAGAFQDPQSPPQTIHVGLNGRHLGTLEFGHASTAREWVLEIPKEVVGWTGWLRFTFDIAHPTSPKSIGLSEDERKLGMSLLSLTVERRAP